MVLRKDIKEVVILGAGFSSRMKSSKECSHYPNKWQIPIPYDGEDEELTILHLSLLPFITNEFNRFVVVVREDSIQIAEYLIGQLLCEHLSFLVVPNQEPERGNGYSLLSALSYTQSEFFYLNMADNIHSPSTVKRLIDEYSSSKVDGIVVVDANGRPWVDIAEATKVKIEDGYVQCFGKTIDSSCVDVGVFVLGEKEFLLDVGKQLTKSGRPFGVSNLLNRAISEGYEIKPIYLGPGDSWKEIDTVKDLRDLFLYPELSRLVGELYDLKKEIFLNKTKFTMALQDAT